jgi:uncharacterized cupin superfamily protein
MTHPIINLAGLSYDRDVSHADKFGAKLAPIGPKIGARKLGYNVTLVPPGKRAFPHHNHHANEEMFFILEGSGVLRFGKDEHPVRAGDFIACPPGGPEVAHQLVNTGEADLKYLAVSTMLDSDVYQYPDSGKVGMSSGRALGMWPPEFSFAAKFYDESANVDYWKGE